MISSLNPRCETCAERGREREGIHRVGSGWMCGPCFRGEGSRAERTICELSEAEREARRRYRQKNRSMHAEYQRRYRERKRAEREAARAGNQALYEAGTATGQTAAAP